MLREQILEDIKSAMKSGDTFKRDALRMVNAALKQVEVDERIKLSDERVISILQKEIKSRVDSVEAYKKGGRDDLVKKEQGEIELIKTYLPAELSDDELKDEIKKIISETGACGMKFMGDVMKLAKERIGTKVSGKRLSETVKKYLA